MEDGKKEVPSTSSTPKIAREAAVVDFERFVDTWEIDANIAAMNAEDKESFNLQKERIIVQIMAGDATVDQTGAELTYTPRHSNHGEITFRIPKGAAYMAMDQFKERQGMHKLAGFMASMTGEAAKTFSNMDSRDVKFCMGVAILFLGS